MNTIIESDRALTAKDPWLGVELRHLAALDAVARTGSFGRAAEALGYTQSAVSQQIGTLERLVGERLLERPGGPRAVTLTEAGELLLRHAEAIVARLRAAEADMAALRHGQAGALHVGTFQSVGARILPAVLRRFRAAWPRVEIRLTESASDDELLGLVERGELDLAFAMLPLPEGPFEAEELLADRYVLVVPAEHPLAAAGRASLADLDGLPLIGNRACRSTALAESELSLRGVSPDVAFRSDDNGTVQSLVASGFGAALVPLLAVDAHDDRVAVLDVEPEIPARRIALAWHRDRHRSPAARAFLDLARAVGVEVGEDLVALCH
ncbi:MAG TPA: LysR family transcriptional regulator [Gaiellaceae bacterium]|nr:LysR family transcriptional regulator [Gaiellaceae bacterium]